MNSRQLWERKKERQSLHCTNRKGFKMSNPNWHMPKQEKYLNILEVCLKNISWLSELHRNGMSVTEIINNNKMAKYIQDFLVVCPQKNHTHTDNKVLNHGDRIYILRKQYKSLGFEKSSKR